MNTSFPQTGVQTQDLRLVSPLLILKSFMMVELLAQVHLTLQDSYNMVLLYLKIIPELLLALCWREWGKKYSYERIFVSLKKHYSKEY